MVEIMVLAMYLWWVDDPSNERGDEDAVEVVGVGVVREKRSAARRRSRGGSSGCGRAGLTEIE